MILLNSCDKIHRDELEDINVLCDSDPSRAVSELDSIDRSMLNESDKHYYDFLTIKSKDKAYILHTNDSLILDVIDWYTNHQATPLYPEVLYYGGRVYSDIGDCNTATQYYLQALEILPENKENARLRSRILSQLGRQLEKLQLYSEAIPYLEESIEINRKYPNNNLNLAYEYDVLAGCYLYLKDYTKAKQLLNNALAYSSSLPSTEVANIKVGLADIYLNEDKIDSALVIIRNLPKEVDADYYYYTVAKAAKIYNRANILDTALTYAKVLLQSNNPSYARDGYKIILSSDITQSVSKDSLISLVSKYKEVVEKYLNEHEATSTIIQNSIYNYNRHVKAREISERKNQKLAMGLFVLLAVIAVMAALVFFIQFHNMKLKLKFYKSMELIRRLRECVTTQKVGYNSLQDFPEGKCLSKPNNEDSIALHPKKLKVEILEEIQSSIDNPSPKMPPEELYESRTIKDILSKIRDGKGIPEKTDIWEELESVVERLFPGFTYRFRIITEDNLTPTEFKLALLMKSGFSPSQISLLNNRAKNTISTQRKNLAKKIMGGSISSKALDTIISSL